MTTRPITFDPLAPGFTADPYPLLRRLREEEPVHLSPRGYWVLTRYDDVAAVLGNSRLFGVGLTRERIKARYGSGAAFDYVSRRLSSYDPPDHARLRSLVTRAFTMRRVEAMRPRIQVIADELLRRSDGMREMDVIAELAHPLPSLVICEMLGVPVADRPLFSAWTHAVQHLLAPAISAERLAAGEEAAGEFLGYVGALARERRRNPGDDLLSALVAAEESGDRLSEEELAATVVFLFSAGHSTTRDLVGNGLVALLRHRAQWQRLVDDPARVQDAVEESLRYDASVTMFSRRALQDTRLGNQSIAAGAQIFVSISAANRDPARFPDPDGFDLSRPDKSHLSFGGGIHYCLGASLARAEAGIIFRTLAARHPRLELAQEVVEWRDALAFRGPVALPVSLGI